MVSLNVAKAFPHWKFKGGPTTTGADGNSTSKTTVHSVYWKDLDINQGRFHPSVSDAPHAPWGWDLLEEMELTLLLMTRPFMRIYCLMTLWANQSNIPASFTI